MVKQKIMLASLLIVFLFPQLFGQQTENTLSLEDCILSAVENNLNVAVQVLNPQLADLSVNLANEKFLPQLSFGVNRQHTNSASFSWINAADTEEADYSDYEARLSQEIPTGGNFSVRLFNYNNDTNRNFQTINPVYYSSLSFNFTQPLLKNAGFLASRREIIIAKFNADISETQFKTTLLQTIYDVESAYWNYVFSIEDLNVKMQSLELARDLLRKNNREVEVGTLAPIEILTAEAEVATREADILQSEVLVKNYEDSLRTVINMEPDIQGAVFDIIPGDAPSYEKRDVSLEDALSTAMSHRPDLDSYRLDIQSKQVEFSFAKNQLLPNLSFTAQYWSPGVSGTQIMYQDNNPLTGVITGTLPGDVSDSLRDAFDFKYQNWAVGFTLDIPLNSIFSRAQYAQARVNLEQSRTNLKYQEQQIFLQIRNAVRLVQTNFKRIQAYKVARELALKKLDAEEKKLIVGLSTNYVVLQNQRDLANARSQELRAIIDYNLSLAALDQATGISLSKKKITVAH